MLNVEIYQVGELATNCYLITDDKTGESAVIDPGASSESLEKAIKAAGEKIKYILLTHAHYDHIGYVSQVKKTAGAEVVVGKADEAMLRERSLNLAKDFGADLEPVAGDILVSDGDTLMLGGTEINVLGLPGHTKGGTGYLADEKLFCGDTLFKGSMGRTDFPGGSESEILSSLKKLSRLPDETIAYCGHGESTTIGREKASNHCMIYAMERY